MAYNISFIGTSNTLYDFAYNINALTYNIFSIMLLVGIFLFVFSKSLERGTSIAFIISSFTTLVVGSLFMFLGFIQWYVMTLIMVLFLGSVVISFFEA